MDIESIHARLIITNRGGLIMTNNNIQQTETLEQRRSLLKYEIVSADKVEERLNSGYRLHGSPVFDSKQGKLYQAVTMQEPLKLQRLSAKKRRIYAMHMAGIKTAAIAKAMCMQPRTITIYLSQIKQFIISDDNNN